MHRSEQFVQFTVIGWTDASGSFRRAPETAGADASLWAAGERLRQTVFRQPPEDVSDTRGIPLWSLLEVRAEERPYWCLAIYHRAPGEELLQLAFSFADVSAADVWAAALTLADERWLIPWLPPPRPTGYSRAALNHMTLSTIGHPQQLTRRLVQIFSDLTSERPRILLDGTPMEALTLIGTALAQVPDEVVSDYLWTTCLLHPPVSTKSWIISGKWPTQLASDAPESAQHIASSFSESYQRWTNGDQSPLYRMLIERLAVLASRGRHATEEERSAHNLTDMLEMMEDAETILVAGEEPQVVTVERAEAPSSAIGSRQESPHSINPVQAAAWALEEPARAAAWLFSDSSTAHSGAEKLAEREIFHKLVRMADGSARYRSLLPVPAGQSEVDTRPVLRLIDLMRAHCGSADIWMLLASRGRAYYLGPADQSTGRIAFMRRLGIPAEHDPAESDPAVREITAAIIREQHVRRKRQSLRNLIDIDTTRIIPIASYVRAAGEEIGAGLTVAGAFLLLELLADCYEDAPLPGTRVAADAQADCTEAWARSIQPNSHAWLISLMDELGKDRARPVDRSAVLAGGLAAVAEGHDLPKSALDSLKAIEFAYPSASAAQSLADLRVMTAPRSPESVSSGGPKVHTPKGSVFISYSRDDREYVQELAAYLQDFGLPIWWDYQIEVGVRFTQELQLQIERCAAFIVVLSPKAVASNWVQNEIHYALREGKLVLPLVLHDCKIPLQLTSIHHEKVTGGRMPSARFVDRLTNG